MKPSYYFQSVLFFLMTLCQLEAQTNLRCIVIDPTDMEILTYPNPATTEIFIATHKDSPIRSISVFDLKGVLSTHINDINDNYYYLNVKNLMAGQYTLLLEFDQGVAARQVIVN